MFALPPLPLTLPTTTTELVATTTLQVPFYSQFLDITLPYWKGKSCGVTSLAMLIEYYTHATTSPDTILRKGLAANGFIPKVGWTYKSLITVAKQYGLEASAYDFGGTTNAIAYSEFRKYINEGPVMVSVHYKFDPKSTIPHLVVINSIKDDVVYYNDPALSEGQKEISLTDFLKAWKKRFVVIRPTQLEIAATPL